MPTLITILVTVAMVAFATIAFATGRLRWRITTGAIAGGVLAAGLAIVRGHGHSTASGIAIIAGFLGLLALAFHYALRELGALDAPPEPPAVLDSGPDILSVDLTDRD
jgi:hypothetical protein